MVYADRRFAARSDCQSDNRPQCPRQSAPDSAHGHRNPAACEAYGEGHAPDDYKPNFKEAGCRHDLLYFGTLTLTLTNQSSILQVTTATATLQSHFLRQFAPCSPPAFRWPGWIIAPDSRKSAVFYDDYVFCERRNQVVTGLACAKSFCTSRSWRTNSIASAPNCVLRTPPLVLLFCRWASPAKRSIRLIWRLRRTRYECLHWSPLS